MVGLTVLFHFSCSLGSSNFKIFPGEHALDPLSPKTFVSLELAWPIIPTLTIWSWFLMYAHTPPPSPHKKSRLQAWGVRGWDFVGFFGLSIH